MTNNKIAIAVLTRGYYNEFHYNMLIERNKKIYDEIISKTDYDFDIIIFHEGNITNYHQEYISSHTINMKLNFVNVKETYPYTAFDDNRNQINNELCPPTKISKLYRLGYKHMCYFWSIEFLEYLKDYKYVIRIDEDCLVSSFDTEIINKMDENEIYFVCPYFQGQDEPEVIVGLEKLWEEYVLENNIIPFKKFDEISCPYTNFMIFNMDYIRKNKLINIFLNKINKSHGIYSNRWGDLPIWGVILSTIVGENYYLENKKISYYHGSHYKSINKNENR